MASVKFHKSPLFIGPMLWASQKVGADKVKSFVSNLTEGANLTKDGPELWLQKKLTNAHSHAGPTQREYLVGDVLVAFKAFCEGNNIDFKFVTPKRRQDAYNFFKVA